MLREEIEKLLREERLTKAEADGLTVMLDQALAEASVTADLGDKTSTGSLGSMPTVTGLEEPLVDLEHETAGSTLDRFIEVGPLGKGSGGQVVRVIDEDLGRSMAMKIVNADLAKNPIAVARFIEEAQATAQLQHPGVVPVHELGQLEDGRWYFTMAEVRGRTFRDVITEVHKVSRWGTWTAAPSGWTFRRLVEAFRRVCETVAYAHSRGVVHRDLKPSNLMVGEHGEALVLDWGLGKVTGRGDLRSELTDPVTLDTELVSTSRSRGSAQQTQAGRIAGTPCYMAPEQALGRNTTARSDVYCLGAILYHLMSGHRPYYPVRKAQDALRAVVKGPPPPVEETTGLPLPPELVAICQTAMSRVPDERYDSAERLAKDLGDWLDGSKRAEQALGVVDEARQRLEESQQLAVEAQQLEERAQEMLESVDVGADEEEKLSAWHKEDEAHEIEALAALKELEYVEGLQAALRIEPTLTEAHAALADYYRGQHTVAEAARDRTGELRMRRRLETHFGALPDGHSTKIQLVSYLEGTGRLTIVTDPPGAEVRLHRYESRRRRLEPVFDRVLGNTPLRSLPLAQGSHLLTLHHPDAEDVYYPLSIARQEHWTGRPPGVEQPEPVRLPARGSMGPDDCFVPAGWYWCGGDDKAMAADTRHRLWCDAFVVRRFGVTNQEYMGFLEDLVTQDREEEALKFAPRERGGTEGELGRLIYGRNSDGQFFLRPDADGDLWEPDFPVCMVDWLGASAYAAWRAEKDGVPWRLPTEWEWEKAARGVDGRTFPWGDFLDPTWCCMNQQAVKGVYTYPVDVSVYGVRGMAGNMRDWCGNREAERPLDSPWARDHAEAPGPDDMVSVRGGSWFGDLDACRCAARLRNSRHFRYGGVGFRLFRSLT